MLHDIEVGDLTTVGARMNITKSSWNVAGGKINMSIARDAVASLRKKVSTVGKAGGARYFIRVCVTGAHRLRQRSVVLQHC